MGKGLKKLIQETNPEIVARAAAKARELADFSEEEKAELAEIIKVGVAEFRAKFEIYKQGLKKDLAEDSSQNQT